MLLAANDDFSIQGRGIEIMRYAASRGVTFRDDSIAVQGGDQAWHHAWMTPDFWPRLPVILEMEHYGSTKKRGFWGDGSVYLNAVEEHHASNATLHWYPREFLKENRDLVRRVNLRLGYRLQLLEASWPEEVQAGTTLAAGYRWRNAGVAPCLRAAIRR